MTYGHVIIIGSQEYKHADYPTIFKLVREAHPDAELCSFCNRYPISEGIIERDLKVTKERGEDDVLTGKICSCINLKKPEDLTVWNHVTMVVDRDVGTVRIYTNFAESACNDISAGLKNVSFDSGLALNFGQDGTGRYKCPLSAQFDDLLIFDSALSADEIARLGEYYLK